jgi:hypothetical protein
MFMEWNDEKIQLDGGGMDARGLRGRQSDAA